jgi:hypothetical protein
LEFVSDNGGVNLPTPIELLHANGVIGFFLRQLPRAVLDKTETKDDPWTWLAEWVDKNPGKSLRIGKVEMIWPASFRKTFEAAASQKEALRRLGEVAAGAGSISTNRHRKLGDALKNDDPKTAKRCVNKMASSILQWDKQWFKSAPPEIRKVVRRIEKKSYAADVRSRGRTKADKKWKNEDNAQSPLDFKRGTKEQKIGTELTLGWLSVGDDGFPGYCFISDKILATMLGLTLPFQGLSPTSDDADNERGGKFIEDCRLDIGLKKAEIIVTRLKKVNECKWAILDEDDNEVGYFQRAGSFPQK